MAKKAKKTTDAAVVGNNTTLTVDGAVVQNVSDIPPVPSVITGAPEQVIYVPPSQLVGDNNSRFGLKQSRVETLMQSILDKGGIMVPLEVNPLPAPSNGVLYRVTDGHYRLEAATQLAKDHDGVMVPILIRPGEANEVDRLKKQTALNHEREQLSPMDVAVAAKSLLDAGVPRQEIRELFKRSGGRKGDKVQPASNSFINMMISFLDFPADIQAKIHEGIIGVGAAYNLTKKPREKWAEIVAACEAEREEELKADAAREEKYLAEIKAEEERAAKQKQLETEAALAKTALEEATKLADEKVKAEADATMAARKVGTVTDADEKKKILEAHQAAIADAKGAMAKQAEAKKAADALQAKLDKVRLDAEKRAEKLAEARRAAAEKQTQPASDKPAKAIGGAAVDKAAAKVGAGNTVQLNATQMRAAVDEWALPGSGVKVQAIAQIIKRCFSSEITPQQAYTEMLRVTGEGSKK